MKIVSPQKITRNEFFKPKLPSFSPLSKPNSLTLIARHDWLAHPLCAHSPWILSVLHSPYMPTKDQSNSNAFISPSSFCTKKKPRARLSVHTHTTTSCTFDPLTVDASSPRDALFSVWPPMHSSCYLSRHMLLCPPMRAWKIKNHWRGSLFTPTHALHSFFSGRYKMDILCICCSIFIHYICVMFLYWTIFWGFREALFWEEHAEILEAEAAFQGTHCNTLVLIWCFCMIVMVNCC